MLGYDSIIVLPILLLLAVFGALIAFALIVYTEAISRSCEVCGVEFLGSSDMKEHMKDHAELLDFARPVSKESYDKAA